MCSLRVLTSRLDCCGVVPIPKRASCASLVAFCVSLHLCPRLNEILQRTHAASLFPICDAATARYVHLLKDKVGSKRKCKYVDVFFWNKNGGWRKEERGERCALIVPDLEIKSRTFEAELDMETGLAKPRPEIKRDTNPLDNKPRDNRYYAFTEAKGEMVDYLRHLLGTHERNVYLEKQNHPEPLVVMCGNDGQLGLILNWACSLRAANIEMPKHVIFVTSAKTRDFLKSLGFTAYYHAKIGTYPSHASKKYSDLDFGMMMILKQVAVALSLESGYDVLFQVCGSWQPAFAVIGLANSMAMLNHEKRLVCIDYFYICSLKTYILPVYKGRV